MIRPIIFSAPMIRALLDGRKTMTRRIVKPQPDLVRDVVVSANVAAFVCYHDQVTVSCPYGQPGDLLWVKESWAQRLDRDYLNGTQLYESGVREAWYWADGPGRTCNTGCAGAAGRVRTARFMPRWASRITLRLTDVRVERLQEIDERDALAEGVAPDGDMRWNPVQAFELLWQSIHGPDSWQANPWVWALTFTVHKCNVDSMEQP